MSIHDWRRIEPTTIIDADYRKVVIKTFEVPGTTTVQRYSTWLSEGSRSAGVIALTKDNQVIIARQFRHGPEKVMDELPGGAVNDGEDPQAAAVRELEEETGYRPGTITYLGENTRDAYTNGEWHYYLALDCEPNGQGQNLDDGELVEIALITISQLIDNAKKNMMTDPVAILMAYDRLMEIQEKAHD